MMRPLYACQFTMHISKVRGHKRSWVTFWKGQGHISNTMYRLIIPVSHEGFVILVWIWHCVRACCMFACSTLTWSVSHWHLSNYNLSVCNNIIPELPVEIKPPCLWKHVSLAQEVVPLVHRSISLNLCLSALLSCWFLQESPVWKTLPTVQRVAHSLVWPVTSTVNSTSGCMHDGINIFKSCHVSSVYGVGGILGLLMYALVVLCIMQWQGQNIYHFLWLSYSRVLLLACWRSVFAYRLDLWLGSGYIIV